METKRGSDGERVTVYRIKDDDGATTWKLELHELREPTRRPKRDGAFEGRVYDAAGTRVHITQTYSFPDSTIADAQDYMKQTHDVLTRFFSEDPHR